MSGILRGVLFYTIVGPAVCAAVSVAVLLIESLININQLGDLSPKAIPAYLLLLLVSLPLSYFVAFPLSTVVGVVTGVCKLISGRNTVWVPICTAIVGMFFIGEQTNFGWNEVKWIIVAGVSATITWWLLRLREKKLAS